MVDVADKEITVIGAERSGVAVAKLLKRHRGKVFVSDVGSSETTRLHIDELNRLGIEGEYGKHSERVYQCSFMVISPGVPTDAPVVVEAQQRGIKVVAEIEVASWFCKGTIIAITGSNGKTTTTTLLGRIFSDAKKKHVVAGNIGTAFSSYVLDIDQETLVVLEVSSFQLDFIETFHPHIAVILNITQNHMDRYEHSMQRYASSKARIFMNQTADDILIINASDPWIGKVSGEAKSTLVGFSTTQELATGAYVQNESLTIRFDGKETPVLHINEISIKGEHNLQNAMAAALAAQQSGVTPAYYKSTLRNFKGVEHRQEFVREVNGIKYINNSKATTVEAVEAALKSYTEPIVLIMGGKDKGNDYSTIFDLVRHKVKTLVATGHSSDTIMKNFSDKVRTVQINTEGKAIPNIGSMKKAIDAATAAAAPGDLVLLAPACTSFDWFHDYEERGRIFKHLVNELN